MNLTIFETFRTPVLRAEASLDSKTCLLEGEEEDSPMKGNVQQKYSTFLFGSE